MKKSLLGLVAIGTLLAVPAIAPAMAADMPLKAPPPPPAPLWTGWYIGGNVGGSFGRASETSSFAGTAVAAPSTSLDGVLGGGQIGYNWQTGSWVLGLEADIQATSEQGSGVASEFIPGVGIPGTTGTLNYSEKLPWLGTVRARLGVTPTPTWLAYVTGGLAYGEVDTDTTFTFVSNTGATTSAVNDVSNTRSGWTIGGGVEGWLGRDWTAKLEYLYVDLGSFTNTFVTLGTFTPTVLSTRVTDNIVRVGLDYHFNSGR